VSAWTVAAGLALGILGADLVSGIVHWVFDTWGSPDTAFVGRLAIRTFREHHADAQAILSHDFVETNGHNFALSAVASGIGLCAGSPLAASACLTMAVFVAITSQIHKWAHMVRPPAPVRALQRLHVVLTPEHHRRHHEEPHTRNYCITTGWLDAPLRASRAWDALEALITLVTGTRPRG
jgi:ubiquitin-conjugating enzyme E2 variant